MKFMPILLIVMILLAGIGYFGYGQYTEKTVLDNVSACMKGFQTESYLKANAEKFCTCNSDFIRQNPFADKTKPEIKKLIGAHVRNCMDTYNKQTILNECSKMNDTMIKADGAYIVECSCFYDALVDPMLKQWVDGEITSEELVNSSKKLALNSLNACMKMR